MKRLFLGIASTAISFSVLAISTELPDSLKMDTSALDEDATIKYYDNVLGSVDNPTINDAAKVASDIGKLNSAISNRTTRMKDRDNVSPDCNEAAQAPKQYDEMCDFEGVTDKWKESCDKLVKSNKIPKDALKFTLGVMAKNSSSFRSSKCFNKKGLASKRHYSMNGTTAKSFTKRMSKGIKNKCQIVINDMGNKKQQCRATMYYIDLCKPGGPKVTETYANIGSGTCRKGRGYENRSGRQTTTLGAFITNDHVFSFAKKNAAYNKLRSSIKKISGKSKAHSVQLFGLQNSNNSASRDMKYMHVSPYRSSFGCPSVAGKNYWMIDELTNNGPSLLVNYHKGKMEDIGKCTK